MAITDLILADAERKKSRFAGRMTVTENQVFDLPSELRKFSITISGVFDYLPITYLVLGNNYYSSLEKGDFARILKAFDLVESEKLTAGDVARLFLLLEIPLRGRFVVETVRDLELPEEMPVEVQKQFANLIVPPALHRSPNLAQCAFFSFNGRENILEEVLLEVSGNYDIDQRIYPVANLSPRK